MAVNLHATHFRFGIDELAESTHGWHAALDTSPAQGVIAVDVPFLLRFTVQETGGTAAANTDNQFQCRLNAGAFQNITTTSSIVKAVAVVAFANAAACTKRLTGTGTFETSGAGCTEDGLSGGAPNDIAASGNSETECGLQIVGADVAGNDVIQFRLTSPDFTITNDVVPAITVAGATIIESDGAAAGVGASVVDGRSVFAGVTLAAGAAASVVAGAALWLGLCASMGVATVSGSVATPVVGTAAAEGVASDAVISGAVATVEGTSTGTATALGTATNTESGDGTSEGVASVAGLGVWFAPMNGASAGMGTASGPMALVSEAIGTSVPSGGDVTEQDKLDIADRVWNNFIVEGGLTAQQTMRLLGAALAGKVSGAPTGPIVMRDIADTKDRITATVDGQGNRTSIVIDVT